MSLDLHENKSELSGANVFSSTFFFSGMFFDGNHTYTIEPGGQGSSHVSLH